MKHFNEWIKIRNEGFEYTQMGLLPNDQSGDDASKRQSWFRGEYAAMPDDMKDSIIKYIEYGAKPGDFLTAVITNNLRNAVGHANETNLPLLKLYVQWFYNVAPGGSQGDVQKMQSWMQSRKNLNKE